MNRAEIERDAISAGIPVNYLDGMSDNELLALIESRRRNDGGTARVSRSDGGDGDAFERRINELVAQRMAARDGARGDGSDAELAALCRYFDGAPEVLENYHRADPWMNGEAAAMEAAQREVFGSPQRSAYTADAARGYGGGGELGELSRHFDEVMSGGEAALSPAGVGRNADPAMLAALRAQSERDPASMPLAEMLKLSYAELLAIAKVRGTTIQALLGGAS